MKYLLVLTFCIICPSVFAISQSENERKIIYCPEQIVCNQDSYCAVKGKYANYFYQFGLYPDGKSTAKEGIYYFTSLGYNAGIPSSPNSNEYTGCRYTAAFGPFKENIILVAKKGTNFKPLTESWTKWGVGGNHSNINGCTADSPDLCPLVEKREIFFDNKLRQKDNKNEYLKYGLGLRVDLVDENGGLIAQYSGGYNHSTGNHIFPIDYEKITSVCDNNIDCNIYVKISPIHQYSSSETPSLYYGKINLVAGEVIRISSITPLVSNSVLVMTTSAPMNNTIILHYKD